MCVLVIISHRLTLDRPCCCKFALEDREEFRLRARGNLLEACNSGKLAAMLQKERENFELGRTSCKDKSMLEAEALRLRARSSLIEAVTKGHLADMLVEMTAEGADIVAIQLRAGRALVEAVASGTLAAVLWLIASYFKIVQLKF